MAKRFGVLAHLLLLLIVGPSCASSEHSILITARAAGSNATVIHNVSFQVIEIMSTVAPAESRPTNPVDRTIQQINADQPILIAVHLHDATPVMIHITATTAAGTRLFATRCYMPAGVLRDEVFLVPTDAAEDVDGDGWPSPAHVDTTCRDPGPGATGVACDIGLCTAQEAGDCNDITAPAAAVDCNVQANRTMSACIHPGAAYVCGDGIDQDCRPNGLPGGSRDEPCGDMDGDGYNACGPAGGVCDCDDTNPAIHPGAMDVCGNGIDEDCSGEVGGMGAFCDADHDTYTSNVDCNDHDPNIHPGGLALEHCDPPASGMCGAACHLVSGNCACDGIDNNCNGLIDEDASCRSPDLDGDGSNACAPAVTDCASCDCNDCDSGIHPGAHSICGNRIDEDGIGGPAATTGDPMCAAGDTDGDGYTGGQDCGEGDPRVHLDAAENCTTPTSESCGTMSCPASLDVDRDGFAAASVGGTDCNDASATVNAWATEVCDGVDNNCNGDTDEVLDVTNQMGCVTDPTCAGGSRCTVHFNDNLHHCGGCRHECNPGTTLVADACSAGHCACTTNAGGAACAVGSTCCGTSDSMGNPVAHPGCYDTDSATQNCGGCGNVCDTRIANLCVGGRCECGSTGAACSGTQTCCSGQCVETGTDTSNCGVCGHLCGSRTACAAGLCGCDDPTTHGDCAPADVGMPGGNGCETDLLTNPNFCGTCAQSCLDEHVATGTCSGGACSIGTCAPLFGDCTGGAANGCETSLSTTANCGACSNACSPMHADAACVVAGTTASCGYGMCMGTFGNCDSNVMNGCETDLRSTLTCGTCGTNCTSLVRNATPSCTGAGACDYSGGCAAGTSDCNGTRTDGCEPFATGHCGAACTNCVATVVNAAGATCGGAGTCDYTGACSGGASDCNGSRADGCELWANTHCGATCTNCTTAESGVAATTCSLAGFCDYTLCSPARSDCNGSRADGCEVASDGTHCGPGCTDCSTTTPHVGSLMCTGGSCDYTGCAAGFAECNGTRADGCERAQDGTHCGPTCVNCTAMTQHVAALACSSGTCDYTTCASGYFDCNPSRADGCEQVQNLRHCASCSDDCTATVVNVGTVTCTSSTCGYSGGCGGGFLDCDGSAANGCEQAQNATHCGASCTDCTTGFMRGTAACVAGSCAIMSCNAGYANCDGNPLNGCETMTAGNHGDCCGPNCGALMCSGDPILGFTCI